MNKDIELVNYKNRVDKFFHISWFKIIPELLNEIARTESKYTKNFYFRHFVEFSIFQSLIRIRIAHLILSALR